jgi:hypothetical protein
LLPFQSTVSQVATPRLPMLRNSIPFADNSHALTHQ